MYYLSTRDFTFFYNSIVTTDDKRIELLDIIKTPSWVTKLMIEILVVKLTYLNPLYFKIKIK